LAASCAWRNCPRSDESLNRPGLPDQSSEEIESTLDAGGAACCGQEPCLPNNPRQQTASGCRGDSNHACVCSRALGPMADPVGFVPALGIGFSHHNTARPLADRKSTRLNSSHVATSYAVFC